MTEQLAFTLIAAAVGFVSAVLFCVGTLSNTPRKILTQATMFWDFSKPVAEALAEQRAQYIVGALLLLSSFGLQVAAALGATSAPKWLPGVLQQWPSLVLVTLGVVGVVGWLTSRFIYKRSIARVLALGEAQMREDQAEVDRQNQLRVQP